MPGVGDDIDDGSMEGGTRVVPRSDEDDDDVINLHSVSFIVSFQLCFRIGLADEEAEAFPEDDATAACLLKIPRLKYSATVEKPSLDVWSCIRRTNSEFKQRENVDCVPKSATSLIN